MKLSSEFEDLMQSEIVQQLEDNVKDKPWVNWAEVRTGVVVATIVIAMTAVFTHFSPLIANEVETIFSLPE